MNWRHGLLTCFTFTILLIGMRAILCGVDSHVDVAAMLIIVAAALDGLDGALARRLGGATDFGARLDTYVDTVCFGAAPGVLLYRCLVTDLPLVATGVAFFTVSVGVLRFTRGCEVEGEGDSHVFRGLPIPIPAVWIALLVLVTRTPVLNIEHTGVLFGLVAVFMWVSAAIFLFMAISNVRYEKPRREAVAAAVGLIGILSLLSRSLLFGIVVAGIVCMQVYVISGAVRHIAAVLGTARKRQVVSTGQ